MSPRSKLLSPMISAAIVLVVVTNYCIIQILGRPGASASELVSTIWPIALPSSIAIILVMSTLYNTLQDAVEELETRRVDATQQAHHDALTGLANNRLFEQRIDEAISRFRRTGEKFAVLMIDLDHFKKVNDLLGHQAGDSLLIEAATRLHALVRMTDTVARFGGDEFLILQSNVGRPSATRRLCARIGEQMQVPFVVQNRETRLASSIGVVIATNELIVSADYIRRADVALYAAKAQGRNCYKFFTGQLDDQLRRRDDLETGLRQAFVSGNGIAVHFQPQLDVQGRVIGAEALFRWRHLRLGDIPAAEAVELAEECQLIDELGRFVMRQAVLFAREFPSLSVAVNISPCQISKLSNFGEEIKQIVEESGIHPSQVELEVTEQLFMREEDECEEQLEQLRRYGFRLALDDFGTGYSSLNYLRRFRVDRLKLDRAFLSNAQLHESIAIVRAAVTLAHCLEMEVVAEGIESELQEAVAFESGCDAVQGNRYGAAMSIEDFREHLNRPIRAVA